MATSNKRPNSSGSVAQQSEDQSLKFSWFFLHDLDVATAPPVITRVFRVERGTRRTDAFLRKTKAFPGTPGQTYVPLARLVPHDYC